MSIDSVLHSLLRTHLGSLGTFTARGGGRIETSSGSTLFAKISTSSTSAQVRGETASLRALEEAATASGGASLTPTIRGSGEEEGRCWLATDYLDMSGSKGDEKTQRELGRRLAEMHKAGAAEQFGFDVPTHCGVTEQDNLWTSKWSTFWAERRIGDIVHRLGDKDVSKLDHQMRELVWPKLFPPEVDSRITPRIIHGDLWSGNWGRDSASGSPVIFDPSSYYAHNEAELGIMHMFGGFSPAFFDAYHEVLPRLEPYYNERVRAYELYHHLNHALMFGGGYRSGATSIMRSLIAWAKESGPDSAL